MRKIYLENRSITICREDDSILSDPNAIRFIPGRGSCREIVSSFIENKALDKVYVAGNDQQRHYREICTCFKEVNAGGGLVINRRGDFLMINRNGLWDLPKGHQEEGEDIKVTSLREVQEETGIEELELGELICITDHCYLRNGLWHLKHTWWYEMLYNAPAELVPQREEDISKAAWVARSSVPDFLTSSYPSIAEVFHNLKHFPEKIV